VVEKKNWWKIMALGLLLVSLGPGCAGMQTTQTKSTEDLLSAAGFQMRIPDTPKKMAHLQTLTQRQLVAHTWNGKPYYVYADAINNRLYVGGQGSYQRYQQLAAAERIAKEQQLAAQMNMDAAMDWGMWGPWDPWY
jgi:hypothetical protein